MENVNDAESKTWIDKALRITKHVPFCCDWVEYKGQIVFAMIDYNKSVKCNRAIINVGHCATEMLINHRILGSHNYSPETFKTCKWK